jgi:hypothetical protein
MGIRYSKSSLMKEHKMTLVDNDYLNPLSFANIDKNKKLNQAVENKEHIYSFLKFKNLLKESYEYDRDILKNWGNFYIIYKNIDDIIERLNFNNGTFIENKYKFKTIFTNENIDDFYIKITIVYEFETGCFYFIFKHNQYNWAEKFGDRYSYDDYTEFMIDTIDSFDNAIEYFQNKGFSSIDNIIALRFILECKYYKNSLEPSNTEIKK